MRRATFRNTRQFALVLLIGCGAAQDTTTVVTTPTPAPVAETLLPGPLPGWNVTANYPYSTGVVTSNSHSGHNAAYITATVGIASNAYLTQILRADPYRGKRVRWSAWVRHTLLTGNTGGLWMRVDGPGIVAAFDNMQSRLLAGTADWHQVSVVLDVPQNAVGISLGVAMSATGSLFVDDMQLDVVGTEVKSTSTIGSSQVIANQDSAATVAVYARAPVELSNLDFEASSSPSLQATNWLTTHSLALASTDPVASLSDLAPLAQLVGNAHVVGLGEGTHGTREFFRMKHRILEYLVTQMGFTVFAIEATTPEANELNQFVLTGVGDPKILLSRLYFWTWNTQEVLDLVLWMRQWNSTAPQSQRVQFLGFDMQHPGASIDSVQAFITRVDPANSAFVAQRYACLATSRNYEEVRGTFTYAALPSSQKLACAAGIEEVRALIATKGNQQRLHDARLIQQYEAYIATSVNTEYTAIRDLAMAENIGWIRSQVGASARIALWAHNSHISRGRGSMGTQLGATYGADYVNLGFLFGTGSFNSIGYGSVASTGSTPSPWQATTFVDGSLESLFAGTHSPLLLTDMRALGAGALGSIMLSGPIAMRLIGAAYDPAVAASFFGPQNFPADFDLMIYVDKTTASTLLPFVYR